jgi:hypothetical protein
LLTRPGKEEPIRYEEAGSGFPLLIIAGGGLNSTISALARGPFNPIEEFKGEYHCIAADLRNANDGSPLARSRSTSRGTPTPMTTSA